MHNKAAFTLAEVLITLGIIGVVAALTIPSLVQSYQEKATVTALKKVYSTLSQAYIQAVDDNGTPDSWNVTKDGAGAVIVEGMLKPYLKVAKDCGVGGDCFPNAAYQYLNRGYSFWNFRSRNEVASFQLGDGSLVAYKVDYPTCNGAFGTSETLQNFCGYFFVDINGAKAPNVMGEDLFTIYLTKYGMIPAGSKFETSIYKFPNAGCSIVTGSDGLGCAAWAIYNENMDYLKPCGSTLSWNGPKKCN